VLLSPSRGKWTLSAKKIVTNRTAVVTNPAAPLHPVTHERTFKILKALDMIGVQPVFVHEFLQNHAQNIEAGRNSSCASAWNSL
jgi:hypothetical protein